MSLRQICFILFRVIIILYSVIYPAALSTSTERQQVSLIIKILNKLPKLAILNKMLNILIFNVI
jgi:uncharacterized membrane protein